MFNFAYFKRASVLNFKRITDLDDIEQWDMYLITNEQLSKAG